MNNLDKQLLERIHPLLWNDYLHGAGWIHKSVAYVGNANVWRNESTGDEIVTPVHEDAPDKVARAIDALKILSQIEERSETQILQDILSLNQDKDYIEALPDALGHLSCKKFDEPHIQQLLRDCSEAWKAERDRQHDLLARAIEAEAKLYRYERLDKIRKGEIQELRAILLEKNDGREKH